MSNITLVWKLYCRGSKNFFVHHIWMLHDPYSFNTYVLYVGVQGPLQTGFVPSPTYPDALDLTISEGQVAVS